MPIDYKDNYFTRPIDYEGMVQRIEEFQEAHENPTVDLRDKGRTPAPDFVAPEPKIVERFEELDHEDEGMNIKYRQHPDSKRCGAIRISEDAVEDVGEDIS